MSFHSFALSNFLLHTTTKKYRNFKMQRDCQRNDFLSVGRDSYDLNSGMV